MSSTDDTFFDNGVNPYNDKTQFNERQIVYALDQNSGVYSSGQVQFDLSSLANSKGWLSWSEGWLVIPITASCNGCAAARDFGVVMKNGYYQLINSASVKIGNMDVNNKTDYANMHINYKVLSSMSQSDLVNNAAALGVYPDNALSARYSGTIRNNVLTLASNVANLYGTSGAYGTLTFNDGLYKRALYNSFKPFAGINQIVTDNNVTNNWRNNTALDGAVQKLYVQAVIRLKDLHDIFAKLNFPVASTYVRLVLNLNVGSVEITTPNAGNNDNTTVTSVSVNGQTLPIMVSDAITNQAVGADTVRKVSVSVGTTQNSSCRLYVPIYQMNPAYEQQYLQSGVKRRVRYNDIYQFSVLNVKGSTGMVNQILSNGISNMKKLIIVPILNAQSNGNASPLVSPLTTEPGTPSMQLSLTRFNVAISGKNIFQQSLEYDFENFIEETRPSNNINGGLYDGLSCGLIGLLEWTNNYRYYVVDLSRRLPELAGVPQSLQLMCQVNVPDSKYVDLYCFVEYEKELELDVTTGETTVLS